LEKIRALREEFPDLVISVDGGVNKETVEELAYTGVNRLVVGSSIFETDNIREAVEYFKNI
jgi:pentose-5-phosphate-3-epimerase